ncbi:MAG TPA: non-ribosomal peptide synthetase, partial [Cyanobacteria bacterium UBA11049]|nr:non-ribosomal peptide synthetase [Cyanobacteria bacterium UBA11049]
MQMLNNTLLTENVAGYRLSPQQEHLWKLQSVTPDNSYISQCAVSIDGEVNEEIFKKALQNVVNQHEILRTSFPCLPGMTVPLQVIAHKQDVSINYYDWIDFSAEENDRKIDLLLSQHKSEKPNFEQIVLKIDLIKVSAKQHILLVSLPAMIADAISLRNLLHEIRRFYAATINNEDLSDEVLQYADIAEWQHELLTAEEANLGKAYWQKQKLPGCFDVKLPFEQQFSEDVTAFKPHSSRLKIDKDLLVF